MAVDNAGNLVVAGSSQNATNGYDYVVLKYSSDGQQLWCSRYTPANGNGNSVTGFALDPLGNSYVTGDGDISRVWGYPAGGGGTVKIGPDGSHIWNAPYSGNALAVDPDGNVFLAAADTFGASKLDTNGKLTWTSGFTSINGGFKPELSDKIVTRHKR